NRKWGYVDTNGSLIIPLEYDGAGNFSEGLAAVRNQDNKWGYIDKENKLVIPYQFEMALEREKPGEFHQGLAIFRSEEKEYDINLNGYIDKTGKVVIEPMFIAPTNFSEGYAGGIVDFTIQYVDTSGKIAINTGYNGYFGKFSEGLAAVMNESLWGFVDYSGELVITHQYDEALDFKDGLAAVKKDG